MTRSRDSLGCDGCAGQVGEAGIGGGVLPVLAQWRKAITFTAPKVRAKGVEQVLVEGCYQQLVVAHHKAKWELGQILLPQLKLKI